ncbi:hypothetical protein NMY22_g3461 [Coprinellus aureogranulatus]|nr:hypothetical protein NMY22_g3461 [Coprinellus aureogranulatus]
MTSSERQLAATSFHDPATSTSPSIPRSKRCLSLESNALRSLVVECRRRGMRLYPNMETVEAPTGDVQAEQCRSRLRPGKETSDDKASRDLPTTRLWADLPCLYNPIQLLNGPGKQTVMFQAALKVSTTRMRAGMATIVAGRRYMSVRPQAPNANQPPIPRKKVTLNTLQTLYKKKTPISMVTAYDYPTALAVSSSTLTDITLIGDSLAQVCLGYPSTNELTLDEMIHHARAVSRGTTHPFTVADMPFGSYHISIEQAVTNAIRLVKEGRVESVKMEGGVEVAPTIRKLVEVGIPVMAHIGLQPQKHVSLSGYKVQGKSVESARRLVEDALALQDAGAYSMVVEAVPKELGSFSSLTICWAPGPVTKRKFVRRFANLKEIRDGGVHKYAEAVRDGSFPDSEAESYAMDPEEWERFLDSERREGRS